MKNQSKLNVIMQVWTLPNFKNCVQTTFFIACLARLKKPLEDSGTQTASWYNTLKPWWDITKLCTRCKFLKWDYTRSRRSPVPEEETDSLFHEGTQSLVDEKVVSDSVPWKVPLTSFSIKLSSWRQTQSQEWHKCRKVQSSANRNNLMLMLSIVVWIHY